jgi:hypothetical protein
MLEFDLSNETVNTYSLALEYRAFYFGSSIRIGSNHIVNLGGNHIKYYCFYLIF